MSRYPVPACDPRFTVIVGGDNPLATFFGQVFDVEKEEDEDDECCVLCVGLFPEELSTVEALAACLEPFARLPAALVAQLWVDQQQRRPRSPLQARVVQWLASAPAASFWAPRATEDMVSQDEDGAARF